LTNTVYTLAALLTTQQYVPILHAVPTLIPLIHISLTGSVYSLIAVAVERYTTLIGLLNKPLNAYKGRILIVIIFIFSVSYNFVRFFELLVEENPGMKNANMSVLAENVTLVSEQMFILKPTWLRKHPTYSIYYVLIGNFLVMSLVPMVLITTINFLIYKKIHKATVAHNTISANQRSDSVMATLLFSIGFVFVICHSTKLVTNGYEAYQMVAFGELADWPPWAEVLSRWNHLMLATNASINIFIYVAKDQKFRDALASIFLHHFLKRRPSLQRLEMSAKSNLAPPLIRQGDD